MYTSYTRSTSNILESRLFGLEVKPLPYESSFSLISYFSWRNTLRRRQVSAQLGLRYGSKHSRFLGDHLKANSILRELPDYPFPLPIETSIKECLGSSTSVWFDDDLKICPICFELGYHSVWHQFKLLEQCPVHQCLLTKMCISCGAALAKYALEFDRAYQCRQCKRPISGAAPSLALCVEFREQILSLKNAFLSFELWLRQSIRLTKPLRALVELNPLYVEMWKSWCRPNDLLLSLGCQLCPPPIICASPHYRELHIRGANFSSLLPLSEIETNYSHPKMHRDNEIYRVVLQDIKEWIEHVPSKTLYEYQISIGFNNRLVRPMNDIRLAAYGILRFMLEAIDADHWNTPVRYACLKNKLPIRLPRLACEIPDRVFRLLFLELYSTILVLIERLPQNWPIDVMELQLSVQKMIAFGWHVEKRVMYCYTVCPEHQLLRSFSESMWRPTFDISLN